MDAVCRKLQSLKGISLLLSMKPSATLAVGADIQKEFDEMMAEMKQSILIPLRMKLCGI